MKRLFPLLSLLFPFLASAAEAPDTISVKSTDVVVVESPSGVSISLKGSADDPEYKYAYRADYADGAHVSVWKDGDFNLDIPFSKAHRNKSGKGWCLQTGEFLLGATAGLNKPDGIKVDMSRSLEFAWMNVIAAEYSIARMAPKISLGFGFGLRNLKAKHTLMYVRDDNDGVMQTEFPESSHDRIATLYGFNLYVPLRVCQPLGGKWHFTAMASLDILTHCSISDKYKTDGEKFYWKWAGVKKRTLGYSLVGAIGSEDFGVFCKWTPKGMIKDGFGPSFGTLSAGIIFGL